jgi:DNA-binding CsgD family transcriptional regulator
MSSDDLTPTEQQLIAYLREGLHDAEIGVRLGLPVADVKVRVNQLLQRQRLLDRKALLHWHDSAPVEEAPPAVENERGVRSWQVAVFGAMVGAGLTALAGLAIWPGDASEGREPLGPDVERLLTAVADGRGAYRVITGDTGTRTVVNVTGVLSPELVQIFGPGDSSTPVPTPFGPPIAPAPGYRIRGGLPADLEIFRIWQSGPAHTLTRYGPDWVANYPPDGGIQFGQSGGLPMEGVGDHSGARMAVLFAPEPDLSSRSLAIVNAYLELERRFEVPATDVPAFFAGGSVVMKHGAAAASWYELDLATGITAPLIAPAGALPQPAGWIPGIGVVWRLPDGGFIDSEGDLLFRVEHAGHAAENVGSVVFNPFANLDTGRIDDEAGVFGSFDVLSEGVVLVAWSAEFHPLVSLVSLATGETLATHEAQFEPVAGVRGGFAGTFCLDRLGCQAARMGLDGDIEVYTLAGPILGARGGPFARVKEGASCAEVLTEPAIIGPTGACEPPGRLLGLHVGSDDNSAWRAEIRTTGEDGTQFVRIKELDGSTAWVEAETVDFANEFFFGGN